MKLSVLVDNNTLIDRYFVGEPAVCYLIEDEDVRVLFDAGYSDAFIQNARRLDVDLLRLDYVVLSHGHLDHTWGLVPLIRLLTEGVIEGLRPSKPRLVAHPDALASRRLPDLPEIGSLLTRETLANHFELRLSAEPVWLSERLVFLGEIPRRHDFEAQYPIGQLRDAAGERDDFLIDDSALAYRSPAGLIVITGCSHAGICNIVEQARSLCGEERVVDIIGGFHLLNPPPAQLEGTLAYMKALGAGAVHACHCTDLASKIALAGVANLKEVGVGLTLEY